MVIIFEQFIFIQLVKKLCLWKPNIRHHFKKKAEYWTYCGLLAIKQQSQDPILVTILTELSHDSRNKIFSVVVSTTIPN
jgi:hypothetical protein